MYRYPQAVVRAIENLSKLPGIGPRTAERLTIFLLKSPEQEVNALAAAIGELKDKVSYCRLCGNLSEEEKCYICRSPKRDSSLICVVEEPGDVAAMEKTSQYKGLYHVLSGALSPLDGIGPENLRIKELLKRIKEEKTEEVILATNPNAEGEATAIYLAKQINPLGVKLTRLARGIPMGSSLEYIDEVTLGKALDGRREF